MSELGRRVAVAAIGIPTVLGLVYLGGWFLAFPLAALSGWAAHECYRLGRRPDLLPWALIGSATAAGFVLLAAWRPVFSDFAPWALTLLGVSTGVTLLVATFLRGPGQNALGATALTVFGALYIGFPLSFAPLLHALPRVEGWAHGESLAWAGFFMVALPLVTTWVGDAAAFFAGTAWGKKKLAPNISPNKSWVGFWAGVMGAAATAVVWALVAQSRLPGLGLGGVPVMACLGALLGIAGVAGDLVESLLKREAEVKDSGTLFPGHGGALDRIDSLIFALPLAYCALVLFGGAG